MWIFDNKTSISESGLLEGMTDWHCHLLPGVDDGVKERQETLRILHVWEEQGMSEVWLTPHIMEDIPNKPSDLTAPFEALKADYRGTIALHLAAEHMMDDLLDKRLEDCDVLPIGTEGRHLLVETSYFNPPFGMDEIIDNVKRKGYFPVLAHPERYQYMNIGDYRKHKAAGVLFQLNVPSLVGAYGKEVQKKAELLLDNGLYDLCGTDTHSIRFVDYFLNGKLTNKRIKQVKELIAHGL